MVMGSGWGRGGTRGRRAGPSGRRPGRPAGTPPGRPTRPAGRRGSRPRPATPRWQAARIRRITASPLTESSAPDGSSASSRRRSPTTARAMATRWRSPPDSSSGKREARSPKTELLQRRASRRPGPTWPALPSSSKRQRDVLGGGEPGEQVEVLEHVADRPAPQAGPVVARHRRHGRAADQHLTARRLLQGPGDGQERALARSARSHDRHQLARRPPIRETSRRAWTSVGPSP